MIKRKTIAWIGGLTTAAVTVSAFCVFTAAERRWDEWSRQTGTLQKRLIVTDVRRPVLFGTATIGNAWEGYAAAMALTAADGDLEEQVRPYARKKLDSSQLTALLTAHAETLRELRRGAHCRAARNPIDWARGFEGIMGNLLVLRCLSNLAVTQALAQIEDGQPEAAVDTLLDVAQLGRDLMHSPVLINEMLGSAVIHIATGEAAAMTDLLDLLSPAALKRFADGLTILDEHFAKVGPSLHGEAVLFANQTRNSLELGGGMGLSVDCWHYGFSTRLMFADTGLRMIDLADRTVAAARGPWSACDTYLTGIEQDLVDTDILMLSVASMSRTALTVRFRTIARLRLLRMAIEHRLGRTVPQLADPFGDTLRHEVNTAGKARFWSVGASGKIFLFPHRS